MLPKKPWPTIHDQQINCIFKSQQLSQVTWNKLHYQTSAGLFTPVVNWLPFHLARIMDYFDFSFPTIFTSFALINIHSIFNTWILSCSHRQLCKKPEEGDTLGPSRAEMQHSQSKAEGAGTTLSAMTSLSEIGGELGFQGKYLKAERKVERILWGKIYIPQKEPRWEGACFTRRTERLGEKPWGYHSLFILCGSLPTTDFLIYEMEILIPTGLARMTWGKLYQGLSAKPTKDDA